MDIDVALQPAFAGRLGMVTFLLIAEALGVDQKEFLGEVLARITFLKSNKPE